MSKSKGNFFTVRDIAKEFDYEVIRFFMLSAHYRNPINFSHDLMEQSKNALDRLYNCLETMSFKMNGAKSEKFDGAEKIEAYKQRFKDAMEDDINTADAISVLFEIVKDINMRMDEASKEELEAYTALLKELGGVLGILEKDKKEEIPEEIRKLVDERTQARKNKDFARSDEIRDILLEKGVTLKDTRDGVQIIFNK